MIEKDEKKSILRLLHWLFVVIYIYKYSCACKKNNNFK